MNFILDCTADREIKDNLSKIGNVFLSTAVDITDKSVSTHPDMQIHFVSDSLAFCEPTVFDYYKEVLPEHIILKKGIFKIGRTYPENCAYNIARVGGFVLCNTKYAEKSILDYYNTHNFTIINIKQGYAKCNICPISNEKFITEDMGIYKTTLNVSGLTGIPIKVGGVCLNGFDYGFIGGASGITEDSVLFTGSIPENIIDIIKQTGRHIVSLSSGRLFDLGSIISFT